jgi:hypothetical protein
VVTQSAWGPQTDHSIAERWVSTVGVEKRPLGRPRGRLRRLPTQPQLTFARRAATSRDSRTRARQPASGLAEDPGPPKEETVSDTFNAKCSK